MSELPLSERIRKFIPERPDEWLLKAWVQQTQELEKDNERMHLSLLAENDRLARNEMLEKKVLELEKKLAEKLGPDLYHTASAWKILWSSDPDIRPTLTDNVETMEYYSKSPQFIVTPLFEGAAAISRVDYICNAYESGVGHGIQQDEKGSPYTPGSEQDEAYKIGYKEGYERIKQEMGGEE